MWSTVVLSFAGLSTIAAVVGIVIGVRYFSRRSRLLREFHSKSSVRLAALKEGQSARVVGRAQYLDPPLESPLTGRTCVCYEVIIEQQHRNSNGGSYWARVGREVKAVPSFYLQAGDERAVVELKVPTVLIVSDGRTRSGVLDDPTPRERELANRLGAKTEGWIFNKTLRYREGVIEEGELVTVFGTCERERDPTPGAAGGYRGQKFRKRIVPPTGQAMLISDDPEARREGQAVHGS